MTVPADPEFDSDVRRRIYEYVERNGAATPDEVLDAVRIQADSPDSKPARSGQRTRVRMKPATFASHLASLVKDGYLVEEDGALRVGIESEAETVDLSDGDAVTIRLAREADSDAVADVIREVTSERTYVVAESVAEALDDEPVVRRTRRHSRVVFVATVGEGDDQGRETDDAATVDEDKGLGASDEATAGVREQRSEAAADDAPGSDGEVVGWVHLDAPEVAKLEHTAELTVGVRENHRGRGIGGRLLERGLAWADERGYRKVYQSVPATNEAAVDFLADHGWAVEAVREDHYLLDGEFVDEVMLATWLDGPEGE